MKAWLAAAAVIAASATAGADPTVTASTTGSSRGSAEPLPPPPPPPVPAPEAGLTAADVAGAPLPGAESGRIDTVDRGDSAFRILARGVLYIPKLTIEAVLSPLYGVVWAQDHYDLENLYYRTFYSEDRTRGLFPTANYATGLGADAGARYDDLNLFGEREHFALQATTGAVFGELYRVGGLISFRTGNRISHRFQLGVDASFDRRPSDPFFGIGNGNFVRRPGSGIDPQVDPTAVQTYYRYQEARVALVADARIVSAMHVLATGSLTQLRFAPSTTGPSLNNVYDAADVPGFDSGVTHAYGELELRWDTRRAGSVWEPVGIHGAGSLVSVFAGRLERLDGGADFWRYGGELQHYWPVGKGPRLFITRVRLEGVTGSIDQVPFTELPTLGGGNFLRGYSFERFRDRVAGLGSLEYQWDLSHFVDAHIFTDVGRVYSSLDELSLRDLRVGYGIGLELHNDNGAFQIEVDLASSTDGGIFTSASFSPVLDARPRWR